MYAIHTTLGFIVSSRHTGEAGKLLSIFTKDLGLIRASAQGIRFEKSKLRPFIQDYSLGTFSFVRGKEYWRLTNAQEVQIVKAKVTDLSKGRSLFDRSVSGGSSAGLERDTVTGANKSEIIARIALLLNRLLQGEEAHPELFTTLDSFFTFLNVNPQIDTETLKTLESLVVTRILHRLGYIATIPHLKEFLESDVISLETLSFLKDKRISMNQHINKAIRESHL